MGKNKSTQSDGVTAEPELSTKATAHERKVPTGFYRPGYQATK